MVSRKVVAFFTQQMKIRSLFVPLLVHLFSSAFLIPSKSSFALQFDGFSVSMNRDVVLGALLPLHVRETQGRCGASRNQDGLLWLSALKYAVNEVNKDWKWPLNVSLSLLVRDTYNDGQIALEQALVFANRENEACTSTHDTNARNHEYGFRQSVVAVISAAENKDASTFLSLFKVPEVIFTKTAQAQYSKGSLQSLSVSFYKARALVDLITHFAWSAVSVVYSETNSNDFFAFRRISRIENKCIAVTVRLTSGNSSSKYERVLDELSLEPHTKVTILFTEVNETTELQRVAKNRKSAPHFTWIVTDIDQQDIVISCFNKDTVENTLILIPEYPFLDGFRKFYSRNTAEVEKGLRDEHNKGMSQEEQKYRPELASGKICRKSNCFESAKFNHSLQQTNKDIQAAMNSVFLLAHAYRTALKGTSQEITGAVYSDSLRGVLGALHSQNWKRFSGQGQMKENMFTLLRLQSNGSRNTLFKIGTWHSSWYLNHQRINWTKGSPPQSTCGLECPLGHIRVLNRGRKCCWTCFSCHPKQIVQDNFTCADCMRGYWPSEDFKRCEFQWKRTVFDCALAVIGVVIVFTFMVL